MPELEELINISRSRPGTDFFEGKEGIRAMQEDIMKNARGLSVIEELVPLDHAYQLFPPHKRDHRRRLKKALNSTQRRVIYTSKEGDCSCHGASSWRGGF